MKLLELEPVWKTLDGVRTFRFNCPKPGCNHKFYIPVHSHWAIIGTEFWNVTVMPSIDSSCDGGCGAHFSITNGEIVWS